MTGTPSTVTRASLVSRRKRAAFDLALGMAGAAPQERPNPGENLFDVEGLGDVIVGAGVDTGDLVAPAIARGKDQNRHPPVVATPVFKHADAVHFGKPRSRMTAS